MMLGNQSVRDTGEASDTRVCETEFALTVT